MIDISERSFPIQGGRQSSGAAYQKALKAARQFAAKVHRQGVPWHDLHVIASDDEITVKVVKRNPRSVTKAQKREKSRKASVDRRVATALAKYLKQQNPGQKLVGAKVEKLKGGVLKITPIKANAAFRKRGKKSESVRAAEKAYDRASAALTEHPTKANEERVGLAYARLMRAEAAAAGVLRYS